MRQQDILLSGEGRNQLVALKNEANFPPADLRQLVFFEVGDVDAIEDDRPFAGRIQAGEQSQQGAFSASGCAHNRDELPAGNGEVEAFQNFDRVAAGVDAAFERSNLNNGIRGGRERGEGVATPFIVP